MEDPHKRTASRCVFRVHQPPFDDPRSLRNRPDGGATDRDGHRAAPAHWDGLPHCVSIRTVPGAEPRPVAPPREALGEHYNCRPEPPFCTLKTPVESRDGGTLAPPAKGLRGYRSRSYPHRLYTGHLPCPCGRTDRRYHRRAPSYRAPSGTRIRASGWVNARDRRPPRGRLGLRSLLGSIWPDNTCSPEPAGTSD